MLLFAVIVMSCSSNEELETVIDENLPAIAQKLSALETSFIMDDDINISLKQSPKKIKNRKKSQETCVHEFNETENYGGETLTLNIKLFDKNGNSITDCQLEDMEDFPLSFAMETKLTLIASDYKYYMHQYTKNSSSFTLKGATGTFKQNIDSDLEGYIDVSGDVFDFLDGSYMKLTMESTITENSNFDDLYDITNEELDVLFKIGFEVNSEDYHFDMKMNEEDLEKMENSNSSDISVEYNLLNASNQKVGVIKYTLDEFGNEEFALYDLDGIIVE